MHGRGNSWIFLLKPERKCTLRRFHILFIKKQKEAMVQYAQLKWMLDIVKRCPIQHLRSPAMLFHLSVEGEREAWAQLDKSFVKSVQTQEIYVCVIVGSYHTLIFEFKISATNCITYLPKWHFLSLLLRLVFSQEHTLSNPSWKPHFSMLILNLQEMSRLTHVKHPTGVGFVWQIALPLTTSVSTVMKCTIHRSMSKKKRKKKVPSDETL